MPESHFDKNESKVVLLIEDNIDDERLTLRALRKNNIVNEVVVAATGRDALDYLFCEGEYEHQETTLPAVIVLDLKLPGLDGLQVLQHIRSAERTRRIPVVVLTSADDAEKINSSYRLGANSYIVKPVDPLEYSDAALNMAMYWLLLNRTPESH
jgi:CheY-like chemotaxis protein